MAEKIISPGVFTDEIDQTFLPAAIAEIGAAIIGPTVKGPALVPTTVTSYSEYQQIFGDTLLSGSSYAIHLTAIAAKEYLKNSNTLTVVRILDGTYGGANSFCPTGSNAYIVGNALVSSSAGVPHYSGSSTSTNWTADASSLRVYTRADGTIMNNAPNTRIDSESLFFNTLGISGSQLVGGTTSMDITASGGYPGGDSISSQHSSSAFLDENGVIALSGSKHNIRWEISNVNQSKGTFTFLVRRGDDSNKRKHVLETWNNVNLDPNSNNYIAKIIGDSYYTIAGTESEPYLTFTGQYHPKSKYVYVDVLKKTPDYIAENGSIRDNALSASLPGPNSGSFLGGLDGYVGFNAAGGPEGSNITTWNWYHQIGTNSQGFNPATDNQGKTAYTKALNLLKNQDEYDFNLLMLPGILDDSHPAVVGKAIDVCEDRGDCFVIVDPVIYGSSVPTVKSKAESRDSNYAAVYWPWVKIVVSDLGKDLWVPPSVGLSGVYSFNDRVGHPWLAPAGLNRGTIGLARQAERKLTQTNRDDLYDSNVNPIATFPGQGVTVFGQKTLQKKSSALDRVNVRRLLITLKKFIASSSRYLVFEQNTATTRRRFLNLTLPYLESVQSQSGLNAFRVVMDETNNTPDVVDRNILYGQIFVQPTRTAEFIVLDFTVQPTGATFPE